MRVAGLTRMFSGHVRATRQVRRRCAHNAGHLAHDTPLSAFAIEVVCDLGATPSRGATSLPRTVTSLPRGAASLTASGGSCAARGPVRDLSAGGIAIKWGELHH